MYGSQNAKKSPYPCIKEYLYYVMYQQTHIDKTCFIIRVPYKNTDKYNTNNYTVLCSCVCILSVFCHDTLMVAEATETCRWISYYKTYLNDMCLLVYHIVYKRKCQQKYCAYASKMLRAVCSFVHGECHTENSLRFVGRPDLFICLVASAIKHR